MDRMLRPKVEVLPASAQVPAQNLLVPPPNRFTHQLSAAQPYYYDAPREGSPPDGEFPAGTLVVLLVQDDSAICRVVDGRGLYVATACGGLVPLER